MPSHLQRLIPLRRIIMYETVSDFGVDAIGKIIPLERETCVEMVKYTLTLPDLEIESHLLDLLGHSEESYKFISEFLQLKKEEDESNSKKLASKQDKAKSKASSPNPKSNAKIANQHAPWEKIQRAPQKSSQRLEGNKESVTISELAGLKPSNKLSGQQAKKTKKKNLDNLKDIEAALNELEIEKAKESFSKFGSSVVRRTCNCMATRHPLFEVAPNCLNCGKIICVKEGLQPCSYCGTELISEKEKVEIIKVLQLERNLLETKQENPKNKQVQQQPSKLAAPKKIKVSLSAGGNLWKEQEEALRRMEEESRKQREREEQAAKEEEELEKQMKEIEHYNRIKDRNPELMKAQERLETLLNFQATGAERTKIIDNASDFEMPDLSSGSMWLSATERALQLKKQQKQLRKIQSQEKARSGRSTNVLEMVIKDGKVKMVEKLVSTGETDTEKKEIDELNDIIKQEKLDQEIAMAKNTWDYEHDEDKWEKPVYVFLPNNKATEETPQNSRVQLGDLNGDELIVALPS